MQQALRKGPSVLGLLFFGWLFVLVGAAFRKETEVCRDCGGVRRFKTKGSKLAALFLTVLVIVVVLSAISG